MGFSSGTSPNPTLVEVLCGFSTLDVLVLGFRSETFDLRTYDFEPIIYDHKAFVITYYFQWHLINQKERRAKRILET